jgi:hypothetical protein
MHVYNRAESALNFQDLSSLLSCRRPTTLDFISVLLPEPAHSLGESLCSIMSSPIFTLKYQSFRLGCVSQPRQTFQHSKLHSIMDSTSPYPFRARVTARRASLPSFSPASASGRSDLQIASSDVSPPDRSDRFSLSCEGDTAAFMHFSKLPIELCLKI